MCDGSKSCHDTSDEKPEMCAAWNCTEGRWKCNDGQKCIFDSWVCDGLRHCNDKSDEDPAMCAKWECGTDVPWKCQDGLKCIENGEVCDDYPDCNDRSDENPTMCNKTCAVRLVHGELFEFDWKCRDGQQCIEEVKVCDGLDNCNGKSDEDPKFCAQLECGGDYTKCADNLQCVNVTSICDGYINCKDRSDELCNHSCLQEPLPFGEKSIIRKCHEDPSICIPVERSCDGIAHCPEAGDEANAGCTCEEWGMKSCNARSYGTNWNKLLLHKNSPLPHRQSLLMYGENYRLPDATGLVNSKVQWERHIWKCKKSQ